MFNCRLVVLGWQRSGTSVFRELLSLNGFTDLGEVFHSEYLDDETKFFHFVRTRSNMDPRMIHPMYYADLLQQYIDTTLASYGDIVIDIKYSAIRLIDRECNNYRPNVLDVFSNNGYSFCQIVRRNKLRMIASLYMAIQTGVWAHIGASLENSSNPKVSIPAESLVNMIDDRYDQERSLDHWLSEISILSNNPAHKIYYENMFDSNGRFSEEAMTLASKFMRGSNNELRTEVALKKQNSEQLQDIIENYDEIVDVLRHSSHEWMLHY